MGADQAEIESCGDGSFDKKDATDGQNPVTCPTSIESAQTDRLKILLSAVYYAKNVTIKLRLSVTVQFDFVSLAVECAVSRNSSQLFKSNHFDDLCFELV